MEFITFFDPRTRWFSDETERPLTKRHEFGRINVVSDGLPVVHLVPDDPAAWADAIVPLCGQERRLLMLGWPWSDPLPEHMERCPECLSARPLDEAP